MDLNKIIELKSVPSAVMVLHELSTDSLVLTKRSDRLHHHPGEICFPGGLWEEQDVNLYETALRELDEELGIKANRITLLKELHIERTLFGSIIHPWFATIDTVKPYCFSDHEVSALILIPMSLVTNPQNYNELIVERDGTQFKSLEFRPNDELVWGATARIMKQLSV